MRIVFSIRITACDAIATMRRLHAASFIKRRQVNQHTKVKPKANSISIPELLALLARRLLFQHCILLVFIIVKCIYNPMRAGHKGIALFSEPPLKLNWYSGENKHVNGRAGDVTIVKANENKHNKCSYFVCRHRMSIVGASVTGGLFVVLNVVHDSHMRCYCCAVFVFTSCVIFTQPREKCYLTSNRSGKTGRKKCGQTLFSVKMRAILE